ncbi:hypothetical protein NST66_04095 [Priestia sp. FSL W8-0524]|uniref:hypothetical protein n=1 Tax=Priestia sp. FSL W8-0524 TaxID=2954625 RepID=UPI0030FB42F7
MTQQELVIDYDYYEANHCSFEDLKEASLNLASASQEQFEQMKKEKWFNRVFDMVTLSNTYEKRIANQIGNLAQAQQIMLEILVRLSERDVRISDLVVDAFDKIERLSRDNVLLAKRINLLEERCILGITKETDIRDLSETEQEILGGTLLALMHEFNHVSEEQQQYANTVLNYLGVDAQTIHVQASLASIEQIEVKKTILTSCLEYCFLYSLHFDLSEGVEAIIDEFDFGNKTLREVKNKVTSLYNLRSVKGFIDKYSEIEEIEEEFYIELPELNFEEEEVTLQELKVTNILYIAPEEEKVFTNNIIHIEAFINCEGHLKFDNCVINYNQSQGMNEITLSQKASLTLSNCQINCLGEDKNYFIQGESESKVTVDNSEFNNCTNFLSLKEESTLHINNCAIFTPGENFINSRGWWGGMTGEILNSKIHFLENDSRSEKYNEFAVFHSEDPIFNISGTMNITNCEVEGRDKFVAENSNYIILAIEKSTYRNCSFKNINRCINGEATIAECSFESCKSVITRSSEIVNSLFKECERIFTGDNFSIKHSQFVDCRNRIVHGEGINIEFCEFYNVVSDFSGSVSHACFEFMCSENAVSNKVFKCLFDGVKVDEGFLIKGFTSRKISSPKVLVQDCDFKNCTTKRSTNVIVKEYDHYYGLFNKKVETKPVSIRNCRGLEEVNEGRDYAGEFMIRGKTRKGVKIGVTVAGAVLGAPGLMAGLGVAKLLKDNDLHQE